MKKWIVYLLGLMSLFNHVYAMHNEYQEKETQLLDLLYNNSKEDIKTFFNQKNLDINHRRHGPLLVFTTIDHMGNQVYQGYYFDTTPLMQVAFFEDNEDIIYFLTQKGADINAVGDQGFTAFLIAIRQDNLKNAKAILNSGADIFKKADCGCSALHYVTTNKNIEWVHLLIKKGFDPDIKDEYENTSLIIATDLKDVSLMRTLILNGASLNSINKKGFSSLDIALEAGFVQGVFVLQYHGARPKSKSHKTDNQAINAMLEDFSLFCRKNPQWCDDERNAVLAFMRDFHGIKNPFLYITNRAIGLKRLH